MSDTTNTPQEEKELSPQELKAMKDNQHKYYKEQIPFLKTTLEYEKLIADIEEARLKYYTMRLRIGQLLAPPMPDPEPQEPAENPGQLNPDQEPPAPQRPRKLKTQE